MHFMRNQILASIVISTVIVMSEGFPKPNEGSNDVNKQACATGVCPFTARLNYDETRNPKYIIEIECVPDYVGGAPCKAVKEFIHGKERTVNCVRDAPQIEETKNGRSSP